MESTLGAPDCRPQSEHAGDTRRAASSPHHFDCHLSGLQFRSSNSWNYSRALPRLRNLTNGSINVLSVSRDLGGGCRAPQPAQKHITCNCVSHVRVLNEKSVMAYGGKGRGGNPSR